MTAPPAVGDAPSRYNLPAGAGLARPQAVESDAARLLPRNRRLMVRSPRAPAVYLTALLFMVLTGCAAVPSVPPNPFRTTPELEPTSTPVPRVVPTETPVPFTSYWVKNHRTTEMWSGQAREPGVISFGVTTQQLCVFRVERPQDGPRVYVFNPYSGGYFWIDADAVGPVSVEPPHMPGPRPENQNCAGGIYGD